jgi:hypothetical protein
MVIDRHNTRNMLQRRNFNVQSGTTCGHVQSWTWGGHWPSLLHMPFHSTMLSQSSDAVGCKHGNPHSDSWSAKCYTHPCLHGNLHHCSVGNLHGNRFKVQKLLPKLSTILRARPTVKHGSDTNWNEPFSTDGNPTLCTSVVVPGGLPLAISVSAIPKIHTERQKQIEYNIYLLH